MTTDAMMPATTPQPKFTSGTQEEEVTSEPTQEENGGELQTFLPMSCCSWSLTWRQQLLSLAVEHDVDAREGSIPEQCGGQSREERSHALALIHAPHRARNTQVIIETTLQSRPKEVRSTLFCCGGISWKTSPTPSEMWSSGQDGLAYLKAGLNDSEGQHAHTRHSPCSCPQQHGLASLGGTLLKEALLQGVEGAEVDAHPRDAAQEGLPEGEGEG